MKKEFPKIIWQSHNWEYKDLPEIYKKTSKTWQVMNPEWDYRYIPNTQARSELEKISADINILKKFDKKFNDKEIMQAMDIWREVMVYEHGGLWADMDSICTFPIDRNIENNFDKEMICLPPFSKFGHNKNKNYELESTGQALDKVISGIEPEYWISNAVFLGKKHNKISEKIVKLLSDVWTFKDTSFMGLRAEFYKEFVNELSIDLICAFHDERFNARNY